MRTFILPGPGTMYILYPSFVIRWYISVIFLLRHFDHWNISVICLTIALKLAVAVFIAYIFRHSDRNDLIFFGHFINILICDRKNSLDVPPVGSDLYTSTETTPNFIQHLSVKSSVTVYKLGFCTGTTALELIVLEFLWWLFFKLSIYTI